jgi:hypothetical protein
MKLRHGALLAGIAASAALFAAVEGSAGGIRWTAPPRWTVQAARAMRMATYTVPGVASARSGPGETGSEAGECGVFYFGRGKGGTVEENFDRWVAQFERASPAKKTTTGIAGMPVHRIDISGTYLAPGGPMMQSQGKKAGWRLLGAIVEAPEGLVFFKCTGPAATLAAAQKEFDQLLRSIVRAGGART